MHISGEGSALVGLDSARNRQAVSKVIIALVVVVVVALAAVAGLSMMSNGTTPTSSTTSTSSTSSPQSTQTGTQTTSAGASFSGLNITKMYVDIEGTGFVAPSINVTTYGANQTNYLGSPNDLFTVTVELVYNSCPGSSCPSNVNTVSILQTGFTVQEVDGGNGPPVNIAPTGTGTQESAIFGVTISAPANPYTGIMTIELAVG